MAIFGESFKPAFNITMSARPWAAAPLVSVVLLLALWFSGGACAATTVDNDTGSHTAIHTGAHTGSHTGTLESHWLDSRALAENLVGVNPKREVLVYLPEGYGNSGQRYPVVYYFHNIHWSNHQLFGDGNGFKALLDQQIAQKRLPPVIVVAGDFRAPHMGCFYGNNTVAGRWMDHIAEELVPFVDRQYRTVAGAQGRLAIGDFFGGYAALKLAMQYPGMFSAVYAMHPVATDTGETLMHSRPDWGLMNRAQSWEELNGPNPYSPVFMQMAQAYLPNPERPPFYADLMVEEIEGQLQVNPANVRKIRQAFLLAEQLPEKSEALRQLRGLKLDWGRLDPNPDHVYANQKFTRLLLEYGVDHEAEEFNGGPWDKLWGDSGRVVTDVVPFLRQVLEGSNP